MYLAREFPCKTQEAVESCRAMLMTKSSAGPCCLFWFSFMLFDELCRFLGEIETDNFNVSNKVNTTFGFSLFGTTFFFYAFQ